MIVDATITGVTSKVVNRKSDGKAFTMYEITDNQNNTWATSRQDLAGEANRFLNQFVRLSGRQEQKGSYTNTYLEDIQALNGSAAVSPPPTPPPPPPSATAPPVASQPIPRQEDGPPTENDWRIFRQCAAKVSAHISQTPQDFWANCHLLVGYFSTGLAPDITASHVTAPAPTQNADAYKPFPKENQFVPESAYADPGPEARPAHVDDDIPF